MTSRLTPLLTACAASALLAACPVGPRAPDAPLPPLASGPVVSARLGSATGAPPTARARPPGPRWVEPKAGWPKVPHADGAGRRPAKAVYRSFYPNPTELTRTGNRGRRRNGR